MARTKKKKSVSAETPFDQQKVDTAPTQPKLPVNPFPLVVRNASGRPSDFNEYIATEICGKITEGKSLAWICRQDDMPSASTVFLWLNRHRGFSEMYAHAIENRSDLHAEEIIDISDDGTNDWVEKEVNGRTVTVVDHEHIQRSRLRVDARKWIASKLKPRKYGDVTTTKHTGPRGDEPVQIAAITIKAEDLDPDARETLRQALLLSRQPATEGENDT